MISLTEYEHGILVRDPITVYENEILVWDPITV